MSTKNNVFGVPWAVKYDALRTNGKPFSLIGPGGLVRECKRITQCLVTYQAATGCEPHSGEQHTTPFGYWFELSPDPRSNRPDFVPYKEPPNL